MEILNIFGSIASIISLFIMGWGAIWGKNKLEKWEMREEYGKLNDEKRNFWVKLEEAYTNYRMHNENIPPSIKVFLNIVKIPQELLDATDLRNVEILGSSDQRKMDDFVRKIYPFDRNKHLSKKEDSILKPNDFEEFNKARSALSEFWDRWTKKRKLKKNKRGIFGRKRSDCRPIVVGLCP